MPKAAKGATRGEQDARASMDGASLDMDDEAASGPGTACYQRLGRDIVQAGALIFLGEWGDRSMLTTIALAAAQPRPWSLVLGALSAHIVSTLLAVTAGGLVAGHLNERKTSLISGLLLCLFSVLSVIT